MTAETAGTHWGLTWGYDRYGNRLSQTVTKGTAPTNSLTVSTTTNRVTGWNYDAAGNTLYDGPAQLHVQRAESAGYDGRDDGIPVRREW